MTRVVQNPTTGETVHEAQYKQWLESQNAKVDDYIDDLLAIEYEQDAIATAKTSEHSENILWK